MKLTTAWATLTEIANRSQYHHGVPEAAIHEGADLILACNRITVAVTDQHLLDWKRGRGMMSCADMAKDKKRNQWLAFARSVRDLALVAEVSA